LQASRSSEPWLRLAAIVLLGGVSGIAYYLGFVNPYLLADYYRKPLQDLAKINGHTGAAANDWALTWLVLFGCYFLAFKIVPSAHNVTPLFRRVALGIVCGWAVFFVFNLIFMYPVGAADLFDQIFRARLYTHYGLNPFTTTPNSIAGDPFTAFVAWKGDPSPYGPLWELSAAVPSLLGGDSLWNNLILFKVLVCVAFGASVALTYFILRAHRPDWALRGTLFFAWNPLALFEIAGNGHNDAIVAMFLLLGVYVLVLARRVAILPALMAGALTKFVPALLIPIAAAFVWRDRMPRHGPSVEVNAAGVPVRRRFLTHFDALSTLAIGAISAAGLALVLYAPFFTGPDSIGALGRKNLFTASLPKVALDVLTNDLKIDTATAESIVRNGALALTAVVVLVWGVMILRRGYARTPEERQALAARTLDAFYGVIFVYLAFATLWFQPWYLIWLIALTAPTASFTNVNRTLLFCVGGVLNYFVWDFIWLWNRAGIRQIQITSVIAVYTLPLFYTLYVLLKPIWEGRQARGQAQTQAAIAP
jgi:hypothetical protein